MQCNTKNLVTITSYNLLYFPKPWLIKMVDESLTEFVNYTMHWSSWRVRVTTLPSRGICS